MSENLNHFVSPVALSNRIISLDVLRGVAVLGILIMNIQNFSMVNAAYINPTAYGDLTGINRWVWIVSHVLASEKFMSVFSVLFGAGMLLFIDKALLKGRKAGVFHYRRLLWLFVFGMMHAYLLWSGDILVAYSMCGAFVYIFRKKSPVKLVTIASIFFILPLLFYLMSGFSIQYWPEESYNQNLQNWKPSMEVMASQIEALRGGWITQMEHRAGTAFFMQTFLFLMETFWRVTSMMLLGMALYKWGILSLQRSKGFYVKLTLTGLTIGYALSIYGVYSCFKNDWLMDYAMFIGRNYNYVGSVAVALGYIGLIMLICQTVKESNWFIRIFAPVGRMAFSNYILQSIICTLIFYGHGFGLFGQVERSVQILIVLAVWVVCIVFSVVWLKYFRFGPLEWLWRSLTYWRRQPISDGNK